MVSLSWGKRTPRDRGAQVTETVKQNSQEEEEVQKSSWDALECLLNTKKPTTDRVTLHQVRQRTDQELWTECFPEFTQVGGFRTGTSKVAWNTHERPQERARAVSEEIMAQSLLKLIKDTNPDLNSAKPKQNENTKKITSKHIIKLFKLQKKKIKRKTGRIRFKRLTGMYGLYLDLHSNKLKKSILENLGNMNRIIFDNS